jgi:hypothetical protein
MFVLLVALALRTYVGCSSNVSDMKKEQKNHDRKESVNYFKNPIYFEIKYHPQLILKCNASC